MHFSRHKTLSFFEDMAVTISDMIVLLDIDGTLVPDGYVECPAAVQEKIKEFQRKNTVYLCTNTRRMERVIDLETFLGVPAVSHVYKKPSKKVIKDIDIDRPVAVIGEKFLTDFLFAKRIGAKFIQVKRKVSGRERPSTRLANWIDGIVSYLYTLFVR